MRNDGSPRNGLPSNVTVPPCGGVMPMMARMVVVLPMPLRPSRVTISPRLTSSPTSNSTWLWP